MRRKRGAALKAASLDAAARSSAASKTTKRELERFESGGIVHYWRMRTCTGKVRHDSCETAQAEALRLARHVQLAAGLELNAYHCPFCDGFHVGSRQRNSTSYRLVRTAG
jgi:hypothetical protein